MTNEEHTDNAQGATRDAETQAAEAKVENGTLTVTEIGAQNRTRRMQMA